MRWTSERQPDSGLPPEIRPTRRDVRLNGSGVVVLIIAAVMLVASVCLPVLLYARAEQARARLLQFVRASASTEAEILEVHHPRDKDERVRITYRYAASGEEHTARASVRRREAHRYREGARVPVRYLIHDASQSWMDGQRPRSSPVWPAFLLTPALVLPALALVQLLRRQARLLAEGRAALALVTRADKLRGRETTTWRVHYEWKLLSGATRRGRHDVQRKVPPVAGTAIPIVYDRDNPQRHARYPLSLVTIPGAERRKLRHRNLHHRHTAA